MPEELAETRHGNRAGFFGRARRRRETSNRATSARFETEALAQAQQENLVVVTRDAMFARYDVRVLRV